ncbi:MAG TPA: metallopeptidase TldD-related protein [Terriglobales bacterium]|nr:metallopeptidase TldD-related protein [Terriglobales bacterium]
MKTTVRILMLLALSVVPALCADDVVMKAMHDELDRSMQQLHMPDVDKPYFIAYRVNDTDSVIVGATLGDLTASDQERSRNLNIELRVGDYSVDNTNFISRKSRFSRLFSGSRQLPLDNDYDQIRRAVWLATDAEYKRCAQELSNKRSVFENRKGSSDLPDFTKQEKVSISAEPAPVKFDVKALEKLAKEVSAEFRGSPELLKSDVRIAARNLYSRYVNSEGSSYTEAEPLTTLTVAAEAQAADGQPLKEAFDVIVTSPDGLHKDEIIARTRKLIARIKALRTAPMVERYNGPVLFEGQAGPQAFAQVFAPALVAARIPASDDPQFEGGFQQFLTQMGGGSLADRLGGRVLPDGFDVIDKPREKTLTQVELIGHSEVDDEAVATKETVLVQKGILKTLLSTRVPSADAKISTGSRHGIGASPTNLFLVSQKTQSEEDLHKQMMAIVKQRGLEYGIVVRDLGGMGLSWVGRLGGIAGQFANLNAGEVEAYKVYPDGREELVRGIEFAPFLPGNFKDVLAVGDKLNIYTGPFIPMTGAVLMGIGGAPIPNGDPFRMVSYVAPSLLFEEVSLKKTSGAAPNPPVASSPMVAGK